MSHPITVPSHRLKAPPTMATTMPKTGVGGFFHFILSRIAAARANHRLKAELARLDAHLLRDIGLDRSRR